MNVYIDVDKCACFLHNYQKHNWCDCPKNSSFVSSLPETFPRSKMLLPNCIVFCKHVRSVSSFWKYFLWTKRKCWTPCFVDRQLPHSVTLTDWKITVRLKEVKCNTCPVIYKQENFILEHFWLFWKQIAWNWSQEARTLCSFSSAKCNLMEN